MNNQTHRRDAKNAENSLIKKAINYLCVLCVSVVKRVFIDGYCLDFLKVAPHIVRAMVPAAVRAV
jgi:hypothetical protein